MQLIHIKYFLFNNSHTGTDLMTSYSSLNFSYLRVGLKKRLIYPEDRLIYLLILKLFSLYPLNH